MSAVLPELIREERAGYPGYVVEQCTSTMDVAWELAGHGLLPPWTWVLSRTQTRGRGQFGRVWESGTGNLHATLRLPDESGSLGGMLSLALAVAVVQTLTSLRVPVQVKWPNDIVAGHVKIGGILIETRQESVLAGIGINVEEAPEASSTECFFGIQAGCLKIYGVQLKPSEVWSLILRDIATQIPSMVARPDTVVERARNFLAWMDESVVLENTGIHDGPARITGIDSLGRLLIQTTHGPSAILSGRICPRIA